MLRAEAAAAVLGLLLLAVWVYGNVGFTFSLRSLHPAPRGGSARVSVIIAARDEERNLRRLLPRLLEAGGDRLLEVIVVDDGSRDATPRVVEEYAARDGRVRLLRVDSTPPGWAPKSYALSLGASAARGEVLLFLDADVEPWRPRRLVEAAASVGEGELLAFAPRFLCRGALCKAVEAVMTGVALGFYGFHRVQSRGDRLAWMYGCCWAIQRSLYQRLGGHEAVRGSLVEDRDFAVHAKTRGARIRFVDGYRLIGVWAYETLEGYSNQVARLAVDPLRSRGRLARLAYLAGSAAALYAPLLLAPFSWAAAAAAAAQLLLYARGALLNGFSPVYAAAHPLGQLPLVWGLLLALRGFEWKGRRYSGV